MPVKIKIGHSMHIIMPLLRPLAEAAIIVPNFNREVNLRRMPGGRVKRKQCPLSAQGLIILFYIESSPASILQW